MSALGGGDPKTDAMIERRRALDKERLTRIKDPKTRTMGIDTDALAAQVADKQAAKASEKLRDLAYDNERLLLDQQLAFLEQERLRAERQKNADVAQFTKEYQGRDKSREYDLSRKDGLKIVIAPVVTYFVKGMRPKSTPPMERVVVHWDEEARLSDTNELSVAPLIATPLALAPSRRPPPPPPR